VTTDFSKPEPILSTVRGLLDAGGMRKAASILREADANIENTGFDNWNGETDLHTLDPKIGPNEYAQLWVLTRQGDGGR
jgi:hypothetical protein